MLRTEQRIFTRNIKFIKTYIMQEHIDATQVVGRDVDFLTIEAVADCILAEHLFRFQQQRTRTARRIDKDAVFDTNRKSLLRRISAEKGLK